MEKIYIALVDTPGVFANIIRRVIGIDYCHVVLSLDMTLKDAYSFGRINPAVPLIAGFVREDLKKILRKFPNARYKILSIRCSKEQKEQIRQMLTDCYQIRHKLHYDIIGLPFVLLNIPFHMENHYVCSSFVAMLLEKSELIRLDKHFSLITPRDFYDSDLFSEEYEGLLSDYVSESNIL